MNWNFTHVFTKHKSAETILIAKSLISCTVQIFMKMKHPELFPIKHRKTQKQFNWSCKPPPALQIKIQMKMNTNFSRLKPKPNFPVYLRTKFVYRKAKILWSKIRFHQMPIKINRFIRNRNLVLSTISQTATSRKQL